MKIRHIITTIDIGGAEKQLLVLCRKQIEAGYSVEVFPLKGNLTLMSEFQAAKVKIDTSLHGKKFIRQVLINRKLKKENIDLIHAHLPQAELLMSFSGKFNCKFIVTRHFAGNFAPRIYKQISTGLSLIATLRANCVIAISKSVEEFIRNNNEVTKKKFIEVIYYGYDRIDKQKIENIKTINANKIRLGTIARLSPEKNIEILLHALAKLNKLSDKFELSIAGEGRLEKTLKNYAQKLGIEKNVTFLGKVYNPYNFISTVDIFVIPSKFEGFGMVLLEAMDMEKRIVVAKNSALMEIVGDSNAAKYFETMNSEDLADTISQICELPSEQYIKSQQKVLDNFSSIKMFEKTSNLYKRVLGNNIN